MKGREKYRERKGSIGQGKEGKKSTVKGKEREERAREEEGKKR